MLNKDTGFDKEAGVERDAKTAGIRRNLVDAGCQPDVADKFLEYFREGKTDEQVRLLKCHRNALLKIVRDNQKRIDCLDYIIFSITRATK